MKPEILSDEETIRAIRKVYGNVSVCLTHEDDVQRQAQRDADVAYFQPLIQQARQEVAREIELWGDEPCPHAGKVNDEYLLRRRECYTCWQSLKSKYGDKK